MKKILSILLLLIFLSTLPLSSVTAITLEDTSELNWYYAPTTQEHQIPEPPKESLEFLNKENGYYLGDTTKKVIYLTFDEGYEKGYTGNILDTLKELDVKAAFFVVKPYIDSQPELIKRMVKEGHLVCNHTNHHPSMASITNKDEFNKEITDVEASYKKLTGQEMPKFFRPPMGKYSRLSLQRTKELGYKSIFWSFAYKDWLIDDQPNEEYAIEKIKAGVHPGAIILLHAVSSTNTKILKTLILDLQAAGYKFRPLTDLDKIYNK